MSDPAIPLDLPTLKRIIALLSEVPDGDEWRRVVPREIEPQVRMGFDVAIDVISNLSEKMVKDS